MPELPEVQTVVNYLQPLLRDKTIDSLINPNGYKNVFENGQLSSYLFILKGKTITSLTRRGKYILLNLDIGYLLFHLRMTGRLMLETPDIEDMKYVSCQINFTDSSTLFFHDIRKFGRIYICNNLNWLERKLGIEPLSKEFTSNWLYNKLHCHKRLIKYFLLDQQFIAGLGNIYVDEALWLSGIHPKAYSNKINKNRSDKLYNSIKHILNKAISFQGTTIINFKYGQNNIGNFSDELQIFGKPNAPCPRCNSPIIKHYLAQRGTHFCNKCQKY